MTIYSDYQLKIETVINHYENVPFLYCYKISTSKGLTRQIDIRELDEYKRAAPTFVALIVRPQEVVPPIIKSAVKSGEILFTKKEVLK